MRGRGGGTVLSNIKRITKRNAREQVRGVLGGWVYGKRSIQRVEVKRSGQIVGYVRVVIPRQK